MLFGVTIYYKPWWMQSPAVHWQNTFCVVFSKFFFYHEWFTIEVWKKFYNLIIGIGFNGGDTIVGKLYTYMLVILLTNSYDLQIFSRTTIIFAIFSILNVKLFFSSQEDVFFRSILFTKIHYYFSNSLIINAVKSS